MRSTLPVHVMHYIQSAVSQQPKRSNVAPKEDSSLVWLRNLHCITMDEQLQEIA